MKLTLTRDAEEFAARTADLFESRIECNLIATVCAGVLAGRYPGSAPLFAYGTENDETRFAALRTPPWDMLVTALPRSIEQALVGRWLREDPAVPGVEGPVDAARAIASAWAKETGGTTCRRLHELTYVLERVSDPPRPASGSLRLAHDGERELMLEWVKAFGRETAIVTDERAAIIVNARQAERGLWVWDHDGPVSMLSTAPLVAGAVRIGPVYTPPEYRRRGYAGTAVAAASRQALDLGARRCMLGADATNPTSNKIYMEIGYRRLGEHEEWAFVAADA
ncbi:MAG: GNAT family N-acetyltransferase [Solirubrobacteraceae bacterium]